MISKNLFQVLLFPSLCFVYRLVSSSPCEDEEQWAHLPASKQVFSVNYMSRQECLCHNKRSGSPKGSQKRRDYFLKFAACSSLLVSSRLALLTAMASWMRCPLTWNVKNYRRRFRGPLMRVNDNIECYGQVPEKENSFVRSRTLSNLISLDKVLNVNIFFYRPCWYSKF